MQTYSLKDGSAPGRFTVVVDHEMAGCVVACDEHPGMWRIEDQDGQFMGRAKLREHGAEFLAAWFLADDQDWT
ncbi:hypothetical protein MKK50_18080 [Methylobacterium sp. J-043]|nr:hypothetical protein [Methylobacterium sp. J-043]